METNRRENEIRGEIVRHRVRDKLQQMILQGVHKPGTKLVQKLIAEQLGVAQGVVREALIELQAFGLVDAIDNRGMFVGDINAKLLLDSFDLREMHEGLAARLCCERTSRAELRPLRQMADQIRDLATDEESAKEMVSLDRTFHHSLLQLSGNGMLVRLADNYRLLGKVVLVDRNPRTVRSEHLGILNAIEEGKADVAERLSREHIRAAKAALEKKLSTDKLPLK